LELSYEFYARSFPPMPGHSTRDLLARNAHPRRFYGIPKSWAPTITFTTPGDLSITYAEQTGELLYNKDGSVTVWFNIETSAFTHTTASGNLTISTLPTSATITGFRAAGELSFQGITKANYTQFVPNMTSNTTAATIICSGSGQARGNLTAADMPTGGTIILRGSITYPVGEFS